MWIRYFLFVGLSFNIFAQECKETKIRRQIEPQKYREETIILCDKNNGVHFNSPDCKKIETCIPKRVTWKLRPIKSEIESPGFAACEITGGKPQFIEIFRNESWYLTDLCFLKSKSFIDNDQLYRYYANP